MRSLTAAVVLLLVGAACAHAPAAAPAAGSPAGTPAAAPLAPPAPAEADKPFYAVGLSIAKSLEPFSVSDAELAVVLTGIKEAVAGKPAFPLDEKATKSVQDLVNQRLAIVAEKEKVKGEEYLKAAAAEPGAVVAESGLVYRSLQEGSGAQPAAADKVKVHYTGTFVGGKVFDSSVQRGQPIDFPLNGVIPCWTEGVQKMKVGGKAKLVCPSAIAYGPNGRPPQIPGNAVLVFEVELLGVEVAKPPPAPAPAAPAAKPTTPAPAPKAPAKPAPPAAPKK